jgi:hypothetical protein
MHPNEREKLQQLLSAFLAASGAPRRDGVHCDHCKNPPGLPHMTFCKYGNTKQALEEFVFGEQKAEQSDTPKGTILNGQYYMVNAQVYACSECHRFAEIPATVIHSKYCSRYPGGPKV